MQIAYPDSPRVGKFQIAYEFLRNGAERPMLQALFGLCVILEVEPHESGRGKLFYAASDLFQALHDGEEIPEYRIEYAWPDRAFTNPADERDCIKTEGGFRFKAIRQFVIRAPSASFAAIPQKLH